MNVKMFVFNQAVQISPGHDVDLKKYILYNYNCNGKLICTLKCSLKPMSLYKHLLRQNMLLF